MGFNFYVIEGIFRYPLVAHTGTNTFKGQVEKAQTKIARTFSFQLECRSILTEFDTKLIVTDVNKHWQKKANKLVLILLLFLTLGR